ncbi:uncharacterized protein LOC124271973 [Haliotis rubra]|uniref:uncharacterized protein LOC124271973 n=1 Tax=Haliotis rubra TaxID=36100 RepID=UPI001EE57DA0|nr:uncharacterized protein LOC124271973 [Haliotis rubra]
MSTMLLLLVTVFSLAAVKAQVLPCCIDALWSATMIDVGALSQGNGVKADFYYDYNIRATAVQYYQPGSQVKADRVVTHYGKGLRYTINTGSCVRMPNTDDMLPNCVPYESTYLGSSYIGTETNGLKTDTWFFRLGALNFTVSYANPGCVPTFRGKVDTVPSPPVNTGVYFNGYVPQITDDAAFGIPAGCQ